MRRRVLSAGLFGAAFVANLAASTGAGAAWLERACGLPARASCGGCAVSCPADAFAVCRAGMSIWRAAGWTCPFQPVCACQRTLWDIWP
jgi:hypothetical protein